jgi:hypothetical protein
MLVLADAGRDPVERHAGRAEYQGNRRRIPLGSIQVRPRPVSRTASRQSHASRRMHVFVSVLAVLAFVVAAACDATEPEPPRPPSVQVAAGADSITVGGTFTPGVNRIAFNNIGQRPRALQLIRLAPDRSPSDLLAAIDAGQRWPVWARHIGGPGLTGPGRSMLAEVVLEPGQYVLLSMIPGTGGALRFEPGVIQAFGVSGDPNEFTPTRPTLTVTAMRRALEAPARVAQGEVRIRLLNQDDTPHDLAVVALAEGMTADGVAAYLDGRSGTVPGTFVGGVQAIEPGESGTALLFLTPGEYALVSLFPEPDGVTPGFQVGLIRELRVE